ncbi:MAG: AraC family transcriptional regulator [Bacteroidota bacterium]
MVKEYQQFDLFGKSTFVKAVIEAPFRIVASMENEACFFYVLTGCAAVISNTQKMIAETNEGLVMKCGNYLNEYLKSSEGDYCEAIAIHLHRDVLKTIYDKEFPDFLLNVKRIHPIGIEKTQASKLLNNYIESLQFYFKNPALVSEELLKIKLKELILLLAKTDNAQAIQSLIAGLFSESEVSFKEIIEANLYNNLSLEELAALSNSSLSSFKRTFIKHYGDPPARYIKKRKLSKAAKMLKSTSLRISHIAYDCGFIDLAHFSKSFQKKYGCSPSDYRLD